MLHHPLVPFGFGDRWLAPLAEHPDCTPARVLRHDGSALLLATVDGVRAVPYRSLEPPPTVGDWLACRGDELVAVLPRTSLLQRRASAADEPQLLAANVDLVLLVCGLDRRVKPGRIQRSATLAWDAGAVPAIVLSKAAVAREAGADTDEIAASVAAENPGLDVLVTSAHESEGIDALRTRIGDRTVTMLGESGAGKSSLLNALLGADVAEVGHVREGDRRGRHTTTARQLHPLPSGGTLIDSPGIRAVGLWVDPDAVAATFADVEEHGLDCRFTDCNHEGEPGCAVAVAVEHGELPAARVASWRALRDEAESAARRAVPHEQRRHEKQWARIAKEAQRRKNR